MRDEITLSRRVRDAREKRGWSQKDLAEAVGVTPGFVNKLEAQQALPSYELCSALASVLELSLNDLWGEVERMRAESFERRIRTRGALVRGAVRTRGGQMKTAGAIGDDVGAANIAREILSDTDLQAAYLDLKTVFADPEMRSTVLAALRAFARAARNKNPPT